MKTILLGAAALSLMSVSAFAADLGLPAPLVQPPFTWSGCYAGAQVGGGWGQKDLNDSAGIISPVTGFASANLNTSGYMVGGQIGCDYQFASKWVLGIEGAALGGSIKGSTSIATPANAPDSATFNQNTDFLSSITARGGYAWNDWLIYAKGGVAWAGDRYGVFDVAGNYDFEGLETRVGWTAGIGVEWALRHDWSLRLEYDYYGFGTNSVTFIDNVSGAVGPLDIKQNIQVIMLGLNFHVSAGPPAASLGW
jgi:outer membrane immunogenic protein